MLITEGAGSRFRAFTLLPLSGPVVQFTYYGTLFACGDRL